MIRGKHIVLGVTGGIAAYKIPFLVRELKKAGAEVRVVMSESAAEFVTPLTLSTLSGHDVVVGTFPPQRGGVSPGTWHIHLAEWAEAMLIAPATANIIAKLAGGSADNAVTTLALALRCPLVVSPAMDLDMWNHPATRTNIGNLEERGVVVLPPEEGELASGLTGPGRLPEISSLVKALDDLLSRNRRNLRNRRILITAGPTYEPIDPVRFIGNRSSGKMGFALAIAAAGRGADVTLISGPVRLATPNNVRRIDVETSSEMRRAVIKHRGGKDAIIMAAAVADFTPSVVGKEKIKKAKSSKGLTIVCEPTADILKELGAEKKHPYLVGFALETHNAVHNATVKLKEKGLDLIVLNRVGERGAGFEVDTNSVTLIPRRGARVSTGVLPKIEVAHKILDRVAAALR